MASRRKQEESHVKVLKELLAQPSNKKCLECDQRGPTYVDVTIGSFVCTSCGGLLRGLNPPHRVKSISMTTFTAAEISFVESRGNEWCRAVFLAKYDERSKAKPESKSDHSKLKYFMELKYEQKRWYESPTHQRKLMENAAAAANKKTKQSNMPQAKQLHSPPSTQTPTKPQETSRNTKASEDLLGSLNPPSSVPSSYTQKSSAVSGFSDGFADFDAAFGGFSAPQAPANLPSSFAAMQLGTQPMAFTESSPTIYKSAVIGNTNVTTVSNPVDKYAALVDLDFAFSKHEPQQTVEKVNDLFLQPAITPVQPTANVQGSHSAYGMPNHSQQNLSVFPSTSMHGNSTQPNVWSGPSTWNSAYQEQPATQKTAGMTSNPFFNASATPVPMQVRPAANEYGAWVQPQQQQMPGMPSNTVLMSSTNPFNIGQTPTNQTNSYFQQMQNIKPVSNPTNPFMF